MISGKTIFVAPIDWGMGHATRCVPLIRALKTDNKVILGVTPKNDFFFRRYFPDLEQKPLPSYPVSYSRVLPLWMKLLLQWPFINAAIRQERRVLEAYVEQLRLDLIISDNRFGLHHVSVTSIFMTHQLTLKSPVFSVLANTINRTYIHQFNEVWVPDYAEKEKRLSGVLSDASHIKIPVKFLGPLSALTSGEENPVPAKRYDYLFLLSGPEPQRSILEKMVMDQLRHLRGAVAVVRGSREPVQQQAGLSVFDFVTGNDLRRLILESETIVCRSGYSSLMDLHLLGKQNLVLIPTPGQSEQEYLAEHWQQMFGARVLQQKEFSSLF